MAADAAEIPPDSELDDPCSGTFRNWKEGAFPAGGFRLEDQAVDPAAPVLLGRIDR